MSHVSTSSDMIVNSANKGSPRDTERFSLARLVLQGQAAYYILTGAWSLVNIDSFQKVTGPKVDTWLVKMVGALVVVIGAVLAMASRDRATLSPEIAALGIGSTAAFTAIDVFYVARRRISPVYLLDALSEVMLASAWLLVLRQSGTQRASSSAEH